MDIDFKNLDTGNPVQASMEMQNRMKTVIREMKIIPELPSEQPKDETGLEGVNFPATGGVLTYMTGNEYPYRGFPFFEFVDKIDLIKKLARGVMSGLFHETKWINKLWLVALIPALWFSKHLVYSALFAFHRLVSRSLVKPQMYSQAIGELHRAFSHDEYRDDGKTRQVRIMLRDVVCMILEFDNAYRFILQDALEELDQEAVKKDTIKELSRILDSMSTRELGQDIKDTWYLVKLFCKGYLRIDGRMKTIIGDVLSRVDLEKIKLTDEDKYFCPLRQDFRPRFLKDLRDTPIEKLTSEQRKDRLVIEKAFAAKDIKNENIRLVDEFNTKAAEIREPFFAEQKKLTDELEGIKKGIKDLENTLNAEATKLASQTNTLIERTKGTESFETVSTSLNSLLQEDINSLQARFNAEAEAKNKISQELIQKLAVLETKFKQDSEELEKKYNTLIPDNKNSYPKRVEELKKLCQL